MKRFLVLILVVTASLFLASCRGKGSSAPAPTNVNVVAGETSATISWDMTPGVNYWVFRAAGADISPQSCYGMPQCQMIPNAVSPLLVTGLINGTQYSFTVNGRIDGGAGGPGSPSVQATPRLAGATWTVGNAVGTYDLHGIAHSTLFVAAGTQGTLLTSTDGLGWVPQPAITWLSTPSSLPDLNAIAYGGTYVTVGTGGVILTSTDAVNWTQQTNVTSASLYAVTSNGAGEYVAAGLNGTIINNYGGTWISATTIPVSTPTLYGVAYGNGRYVAVGVGGTLLTSDQYGTTWATAIAASTPLPAIDLKGVAYGSGVGPSGPATNTTGTFVAVGLNGTMVTSTDGGATWGVPASASPIPPTVQINAVSYGAEFVAVANDGSIYNSTDGVNWTQATSPTTSPIYAVAHGLYDYSAVGATGLNIHSM